MTEMAGAGTSARWARIVAAQAAAVATAYTVALLSWAWRESYFVGDDYTTFWLGRARPLGEALVTPVGGQIVPLNRLLGITAYWLAPMNFPVALGILAAFHLLGIAFLYRTLELLRPSRVNAILAALYATYALTGLNFTWFSSGVARFPYVALSLGAIYNYVSHLRTGRKWPLVLVCLFYFAALGFYPKGILIPLYCAALDFALSDEKNRGADRGALKWGVLAFLTAISIAYVPWSKTFVDPPMRKTNFDVEFHVTFVFSVLRLFAGSLFDQVPPVLHEGPGLLFLVGGLVLAVGTIVRRPRLIRVWLGLFAVLSTNALVIGASPRGLVWGGVMAYEYRYYYELCFLTFLFAGIIVHEFASDFPTRWVDSSTKLRVLSAASGLLIVAHGFFAYRVFLRFAGTPESDAQKSRRYIQNLTTNWERLRVRESSPPSFMDGLFPRYLDWMDLSFRNHSQLFLVLGLNARFVDPAHAQYRVDDRGDIVPVAGDARTR